MSTARWPCSVRLAEQLSDDPVLAVGLVTPTPPGSRQGNNEYVFVSGTSGAYVPGPSVLGGLIHDDEFTINLELMTRRGTLEECMERIDEMAAAVYLNVCVTHSGDLAGYATDSWVVTEARPGDFDTVPHYDNDGSPWASATLGINTEVRMLGGIQ